MRAWSVRTWSLWKASQNGTGKSFWRQSVTLCSFVHYHTLEITPINTRKCKVMEIDFGTVAFFHVLEDKVIHVQCVNYSGLEKSLLRSVTHHVDMIQRHFACQQLPVVSVDWSEQSANQLGVIHQPITAGHYPSTNHRQYVKACPGIADKVTCVDFRSVTIQGRCRFDIWPGSIAAHCG